MKSQLKIKHDETMFVKELPKCDCGEPMHRIGILYTYPREIHVHVCEKCCKRYNFFYIIIGEDGLVYDVKYEKVDPNQILYRSYEEYLLKTTCEKQIKEIFDDIEKSGCLKHDDPDDQTKNQSGSPEPEILYSGQK